MADTENFLLVVVRHDGVTTSRTIHGFAAAKTFAHHEVTQHHNTVLIYEQGLLTAILIPEHLRINGTRWR